MITINENYTTLQSSYLFSKIASIVADTKNSNPNLEIIKLGIGDVTRALVPAVITAFHNAVDEMAHDTTFHGYGPEQGYAFLRDSISKHDFQDRGVNIAPDEIIVSDGSKCDVGNIQELFSQSVRVAVPDPVYPVYVDTNVMAGRGGEYRAGHYKNIVYLVGTEENNFIPNLPEGVPIDLIYLCFPNNPTGATATKEQLQHYVDYATTHKALILYDSAYCEYITEPHLPKSIYEIPGAKQCAIEFRSFSKTAGFTGTRCAYTVIPKECKAYTTDGKEVPVLPLWLRRHTTKFNGVSYPVQKAAAATYTPEGRAQISEIIQYYLDNAALIYNTLVAKGYKVFGGINAPYIWMQTHAPSWDFFSELLAHTGVVTTPGSGFGPAGDTFIRISAFNHRSNIEKAMDKISHYI